MVCFSQVESGFGDFEGKRVIDLGAGTGMLSIGAALLGASHVLALDIDPEALEVAQQNVDEYEDLPVSKRVFVTTVRSGAQPGLTCQPRCARTVPAD